MLPVYVCKHILINWCTMFVLSTALYSMMHAIFDCRRRITSMHIMYTSMHAMYSCSMMIALSGSCERHRNTTSQLFKRHRYNRNNNVCRFRHQEAVR